MTKLKLQISLLIFLLLNIAASAQDNYRLSVNCVDKGTDFLKASLGLETGFATRDACVQYVNKLPAYLQSKGFVTVSLDSVRFDSAGARIVLFVGDRYEWAQLDTHRIDVGVLQAVGWRDKAFTDQPMDFKQVREWQEKILAYMENNGHPFARVYLDSLQFEKEKVWAQLRLDKGPFYRIDSIRLFGNAKISNDYLQHYLDIRNGSMFSKEKLLRINKRMRELAYVEEEYPSKLIWLNTGSILEMYLKQKKSSQINLLVGFLPNNDQLSSKKILITGEANILLKNSLGAGETIGLNWQQLQVKSPRLNLLYQHPYLFNSPIGLDFSFDMFHKDSTFLNINLQLGAQYALNVNQAGKLFIQRSQTIVSAINTAFLLQNKQFPDEADVSSINVGVDYEFNNTNYRLNPTKGNEFRIIASVGTKKIKKNNQILELKDPSDPSFDFGSLYDTVKLKTYQFRVKAIAAKYLPIGKQNRTALKLGFNGGVYQSGNVFRNELFQIGGYKLLRGFDEESQYLSQYAVGTVEYRILAGQQNSYFYVFSDGGWGRNNSQNIKEDYTYLSGGAGLAFETNVGVFNLAWAVGKRNDIPFNLRQSKIHFGFVNYF